MNPDTFQLGVAQMTSTDAIEPNLETVLDLYRQAVTQDSDLVVFPENTLFHRIQSDSVIQCLKMNSGFHHQIEAEVRRLGVPLMITTPVEGERNKAMNSTLLFESQSGTQNLYSKIHLFDVDVEGAPPVRESDRFEGGQQPKIIDIRGWKFGLSICYDLRFSELYINYSQKVDVIVVPSAFLVPTGEAHWHTLLRARAIESQCFVAAPAQSGQHKGDGPVSRYTYGHSLVIDPWGKILDENQESPSVHVVQLRRELIQKVRQQIPMQSHRRLGRGE